MTATSGDRLPYLRAKLKAPRVRDRLEQTAEQARAEGWADEQSLEALLKAEVFARRCGDALLVRGEELPQASGLKQSG